MAIDSYLPFSPVQVLVPFTARYRPLWTGLGIVAAELLVALALTNHYRRRLPYRFWRRAHYLNFAVWTARRCTGSAAGSDTGSFPFAVVYGASIACVVALTARRVVRTGTPRGTAGVGAANRQV